MATYVLRRVLQMIPLLFVISMIIYALTALQPGNPVDQIIFGNPRITPEDIARLREAYGENTPWIEKYARWLLRSLSGELGNSREFSIPVVDLVFKQRLPNSLMLTVPSFIISALIGIPLGIYSAIRQYSKTDYILTLFCFISSSTPIFWFGVMAMYVMSIWLPTVTNGAIGLPPGGLPDSEISAGLFPYLADLIKHLILPVSVLSSLQIAGNVRYMRSSFLEVINQDYVRTAKAKGLPVNKVIIKHALRNALIPIITLLGLSIPGLFGGAILTETVFSWPGVGMALFNSLVSKDFNVVMVCLMTLSVLTVLFQLITDLMYAVVDPRIRYN